MTARLPQLVILTLLIALLATPFLFRGDRKSRGEAQHRVIILTPHNEQIRYEFGRAFADWFARQPETLGQTVQVIWSVPGGTSEIRTMLESQYSAALRRGTEPGGAADLMFGGGQYEHDKLKEGVAVRIAGEERRTSISEPFILPQETLDEIYGENSIGGSLLYDPEGYWYGAALSAFGILWNNDALDSLGLDPPTVWRDLCHPDLAGWVALGNPAQSGSIRKSFDTMIQHHGWRDGWRILRRMAANARGFDASSSKVPIDVSQGDAAAGVCIDFYGRYQAQAIADAGDPGRLGYIDPPGLTAVDADPISLLRGAPNREIAEMFIRFTLTEEGQALWQFRAGDSDNGVGGPEKYELRRLPIRRSMYADHIEFFIDRVDPFAMARPFENPNSDAWSFMALIFTSMAIDSHDELVRAWETIRTHPEYRDAFDVPRLDPEGASRAESRLTLSAEDVTDPELREMLRMFDAMPQIPGPDGTTFNLGSPDHLPAIKAGWLRGGWADEGLWPAEANPEAHLRRTITEFFKNQYRAIVRMLETYWTAWP